MEHVAFMESQQSTWAAVRAAGPQIEAEVFTALLGASAVRTLRTDLDGNATVSLRLPSPSGASERPRSCAHYLGFVATTEIGGPVLRIAAADPHGPCAAHRRISAFIYELAAELERASLELEVHWQVMPNADERQVQLLINGDHESDIAVELLENLMTRYALIDAR